MKMTVFDIQGHGMSHKTPRKKYQELKKDLSDGKAVLEEKLSKKIFHFAWPRGHYDEAGIKIAHELGYKALYTTDRGANTPGNLSMLKRLPVKCRNGKWLSRKLPVYSSLLLTKFYLALRTGR
jgi:peptidoglycan/xylan/chitin deacetylase (PgdA/CDA1 family)